MTEDANVWEEYEPGKWRPAIPHPMYYGPLKRCDCGRWFVRSASYRVHYVDTHYAPQAKEAS